MCTGSSGEFLKRFTETTKWDDPWFWTLSPTAKLLWQYLLDHCDNAGVVEFNTSLASFKIGNPVEEKHLTELGDRVQLMSGGKYRIPKFVRFQFGELTERSLIHRSVLKLLAKHGIAYPMNIPCQSLPDAIGPSHSNAIYMPQEKVQVQEKEKVQGDCKGGAWIEKGTEDQWEIAKRWLADWTKNGADYTEFEARGAFLALQAGGWQWGKRDITDPRAALERQIQTDRERKANGHSKTYQRPNPRLEGVSRNNAVNNYGEAAKRKLERQALEAANRQAPKAEGT